MRARVVAIFASDAAEAGIAVAHVRKGRVDLPIYLYCRAAPSGRVAAECARVCVEHDSGKLFRVALRELRPYWVALAIGPWTGASHAWQLKIAPFFLPPFRVLLMNENADFFALAPTTVGNHLWLRFVRRAVPVLTRCRQLLRGALALPFALAAQQYSPLSRWVFSRMLGAKMHGTQTLSPSPIREYESGVSVFEYTAREWPLKELTTYLGTTRSRWVLFRKKGSTGAGEVADMLPLFSGERTFAVSRQDGLHGWQNLLFPVSCSRQLQPGECARVFAPLAGEILVDRAKLLALGLPRQSGYGSSWYLLFWKAAAAGWHSYSVGGSATLTQLPETPFYDAQFVHTLLLEPALARLQPRNPELARGNVARCAQGGKGFRGFPRVLVLSPYLPYPLTHGGAVRIFHLCRALAGQVDFVLACFREKGDWTDYGKLHEIFREVYVAGVDERHADANLPAQVSGYESTTMRALVPEICRESHIDLLQVEYTQLAAYREAVPHLPAILVEHDITFTLHRQLAEHEKSAEAEREYRKWLAFESERLRAFNTVWTMSEYDRSQAIHAGCRADAVVEVPNGVDLRRFASRGESGAAMQILYVGSFRHRPNYLGFQELRGALMPAVWKRFPEAKLVVVAGPEYEKYWEGRADLDARITIHGFVEDVAPFYRSCGVVVVPLPISAGTNIKVMEALASERAVISTPVGCVGLGLRDGEDIVIRDLGPQFAEAICDLLANGERRHAIGLCGRRTAEERFGWERVAARAAASYETLLSGRLVGGLRA